MRPAGHELPAKVEDAIADFRARLVHRFGARLGDLRLFGSFARDAWGPESDVDLLVVVEGLDRSERREVFDLAEEVFFERIVHLSPFALSAAEWKELQDREYLIASDILREGVTL